MCIAYFNQIISLLQKDLKNILSLKEINPECRYSLFKSKKISNSSHTLSQSKSLQHNNHFLSTLFLFSLSKIFTTIISNHNFNFLSPCINIFQNPIFSFTKLFIHIISHTINQIPRLDKFTTGNLSLLFILIRLIHNSIKTFHYPYDYFSNHHCLELYKRFSICINQFPKSLILKR